MLKFLSWLWERRWSYDYQKRLDDQRKETQVRIRGVETDLFLAMNSEGMLVIIIRYYYNFHIRTGNALPLFHSPMQ